MTIIQHIASQFVEKILNSLKNDGLSDIGKTINSFFPIVSQTVLEIIQAVLKEMDDSLCTGAKSLRKQDGITIKERNISRTVLTELGELTYQRTYFKGSDKEWAISLRNGGHHQDVGVDRNYGKPMWLSDILEGKIDVDINKVPQLKSMRWQYKINFR